MLNRQKLKNEPIAVKSMFRAKFRYYFEVLEAIENPEFVLRGNRGSLKATKNMGRGKWLVVIYRELSKEDGFVITAYFLDEKPKGGVIWKW